MSKSVKWSAFLLSGLLLASLFFACAESPFHTHPATVPPNQTSKSAAGTEPPTTTAPLPGQATVPTIPTPDFYELLLGDESYYMEVTFGDQSLYIIADGQYISVTELYSDAQTFYDTGTNTVYTLDESVWRASTPDAPITKASVLAELGFPADSHLFEMFESGNYYLNHDGTEVYLDPKVGRNAGIEYCYYSINEDIYTFEECDLHDQRRHIQIRLMPFELTPPDVAGA